MFVTIDLETQTLVPDSRDYATLRVSFVGIKDNGGVKIFGEQEIDEVFRILDNAPLICGYNLVLFDFKVLQNYASFNVTERYKHKTFDPFLVLMKKTDRRIGLNDLVMRNLGLQKTGSGADAPRLYQEGKFDDLKAYLANDVLITHALIEHIKEHKKLKYGHIVYKDPVEREIAITIDER